MKSLMIILAAAAFSGCATTHAIDPQVARAIDFSHAQRIEVRLKNFDFQPSDIRLQAGKPYALAIVNTAGAGHNFTAPEFFAAAKVAPADAALIANGQVELKPGQSAVVHLVPGAGHFTLVCTHTGHALLGMKGSIVVS